MSSIDKKLKKNLNNPIGSNYRQIEKMLIHLGFQKIHIKGSHQKFKHSLLKHDLIIPVHNNNCKNFYKKLTTKIIKQHHLYH